MELLHKWFGWVFNNPNKELVGKELAEAIKADPLRKIMRWDCKKCSGWFWTQADLVPKFCAFCGAYEEEKHEKD